MDRLWTSHITDPDEKKRFEAEVKFSPVLRRLNQILDQRDSELDRTETSIKSYDNPNWHYRQAHINGVHEERSQTRKLITFDQKETQ